MDKDYHNVWNNTACAVPSCTPLLRRLASNLSYHLFPNTDKSTREKWISIIQKLKGDSTWSPKSFSKICSRHFKETDFLPYKTKRQLRFLVIPTLYLENTISDDLEVNSEHESQLEPSPTTVIDDKILEAHLDEDESPTFESEQLTSYASTVFDLSNCTYESLPQVVNLSTLSTCLDCPHCQKTILINITQPVKDCLSSDEKIEEPLRKKRKQHISPKRLFQEELYAGKTPERVQSISTILNEHSYSQSPRRAAAHGTSRCASLRKKCNALSLRLIRRNTKVESLKDKLEESELISSKKLKCIEQQFPEILKELVDNERQSCSIKSSKGMRYSEEIKKFAVTLHFYSPRAYEFLREYLTLPHASSLSSWMKSVDCGPGFNEEVVSRMKLARESDTRNIMTDVVMQIDEMAIRKEIVWNANKHQYAGYCDYGTGTATGTEPLAGNALVCLIAGLSGGWKVPIGYIFTDKCGSTLLKNFVTQGFEVMVKNGFRVHALTGDGLPANASMFASFGVVEDVDVEDKPPEYEEIINFFPNPANLDQQVAAVYDVVHMMKLWRNLLAQCQEIEWDLGKIKWQYIAAVYCLQEKEKIVAANKLDRYHLDFDRHKMNVKIAVQTLSVSVADAIDFCRDDLELPEFLGSKPTSEFIRHLDTTFDICNSRNPQQKFRKAPISLKNLDSVIKFLQEFAGRILKMTYVETRKYKNQVKETRKLLCRSARKRAAIGLVVSIKSIIGVSTELIRRQNKPFVYVMTYRFSQDLLELLFNKVRARLGSNNNPNVIEFATIMKKIWHQNLLKSSNTGNCVQQMADEEIPGGLLPLQRRIQRVDFKTLPTVELRYDDSYEKEFSPFYKNCLAYIAGNVVSKILEHKRLKCPECLQGLLDCRDDELQPAIRQLIQRKDLGGLIFPCKSVYVVVQMTDSIFRNLVAQFDGPPRINNLDLSISNCVLQKCIGLNLFPHLNYHAFDFDPHDLAAESHYSLILKAIIHQFLRIRLFDYGKKYQRAQKVKLRHSLTKQILFRNE